MYSLQNQLTTVTDYISSKDNYEGHAMHLKSDNVEVMAYDKDEIIEGFSNHFFIDIKSG